MNELWFSRIYDLEGEIGECLINFRASIKVIMD